MSATTSTMPRTPRGGARIQTGKATSPGDEQVVRSILDGDTEGFAELVRRHQRPIINFLYRMVGDFELALDLSQDVFVRVYSSLDRFDARYRFTTWLYRIASNCAIDHLRRRRPLTTSLDAPQFLEDGEVHVQPVGQEPDPARQYEARETLGRLERSIERLPAEYRELILLRHSSHLSYDEMAKVTGRPLGTVKNRLFRAREALRSLMDREES